MNEEHAHIPFDWNELFKVHPGWMAYPHISTVNFCLSLPNFMSKERKDIKVLEIGCGPGANIWLFSREGFQIYGIDISEVAISKCIKRLYEEKLESKDLIIQDLTTGIPFDDNFFDAVIDIECSYTLPENKFPDLLKEVHRVIAPGGYFFSRVFEASNTNYISITSGDLSARGSFRLTTLKDIVTNYGIFTGGMSADIETRTSSNMTQKIGEWTILCRK